MASNRAYKYILVCLLVLPLGAKSQIFSDPIFNIQLDSADKAKTLDIGAVYNIGSDAITNKLFNTIVNSSFIGDDAKQSVLPYLKSTNNSAGGYANGNIFYCWIPEGREEHFFINLSSRIQYSVLFSRDAYKLVAFGNSQFAGQTADVSGLKFSHYAYQSLQFGFYTFKKKMDKSLLFYGGGLALVSGSGYNNLFISKGSLYTSPTGDSLSLNANVSSKSVNSANMISDVNGLGASINGFVGIRFPVKDELRFQIADLGFVDWFKNTGSFNINRQFNYTGEKVSIINGKASYTNYYLTLDTIATQAGHPPVGGNFVSGLPFQIRVNYTKYLGSDLSLSGGIEYINDNMKIPELDISAKKYLTNNKLALCVGVSLFGYSNYGITAGIEYKLRNRFLIMLGTQHLEGVIHDYGILGQGYFANLKLTL